MGMVTPIQACFFTVPESVLDSSPWLLSVLSWWPSHLCYIELCVSVEQGLGEGIMCCSPRGPMTRARTWRILPLLPIIIDWTVECRSEISMCCQVEQMCLCGPRLVSSAGDAGCSESGLTEPECWLIPRSHKGCRLLEIAGRWP